MNEKKVMDLPRLLKPGMNINKMNIRTWYWNNDYSILVKAPLFREHTEDQIRSILSAVPHRSRRFNEGSLIAHTGDTVNSLMIVMHGTVKGEMINLSGRVIKIEDVPAPGAIAAAFMFGSRNVFPVNVVAVTDTELLILEKPDFLKLLMQNDRILGNFLDMISNRSQFLSEKIKFLNFKTIRGKLAYYILQKAGEKTTDITLDMTQSSLAEFFGVARPSIARAIGDLESERVIESKGRFVKILDREKLLTLTDD
jgi:CRP-like cAMP-binding protein